MRYSLVVVCQNDFILVRCSHFKTNEITIMCHALLNGWNDVNKIYNLALSDYSSKEKQVENIGW